MGSTDLDLVITLVTRKIVYATTIYEYSEMDNNFLLSSGVFRVFSIIVLIHFCKNNFTKRTLSVQTNSLAMLMQSKLS